jgi:hypothetical protein
VFGNAQHPVEQRTLASGMLKLRVLYDSNSQILHAIACIGPAVQSTFLCR